MTGSKILKIEQKRITLKFLLFFLILRFFLFTNLFSFSVYGQTYSLSIWPPLLEIIIQPGKTITQVYKLNNAGDDQILTAKILPFEPADALGNINILPLPVLLTPLSFSFQDLTATLGKPFLIKSGQNKDLILKISVPAKTPEKDYYATLLLETNPENRIGLSQTQTASKIGANLLITISKTENPPKRAQILEFSAPRIIDSFEKIDFTLRIENIGKVFFKPSGIISIEGIFNQKAVIKIPPENVLAQYSRQLNLPSWAPGFSLGPFRAKAEFALDEEKEKLVAETTFIALPYKAILALIVVLFFLQTIKNLSKKVEIRPEKKK